MHMVSIIHVSYMVLAIYNHCLYDESRGPAFSALTRRAEQRKRTNFAFNACTEIRCCGGFCRQLSENAPCHINSSSLSWARVALACASVSCGEKAATPTMRCDASWRVLWQRQRLPAFVPRTFAAIKLMHIKPPILPLIVRIDPAAVCALNAIYVRVDRKFQHAAHELYIMCVRMPGYIKNTHNTRGGGGGLNTASTHNIHTHTPTHAHRWPLVVVLT